MTGDQKQTATGFTLLEMIIVIVLASIVAGVGLTMAGDSDSTTALAGARIVLQDLEYAQSEAICRRAPITVTFNPGANTYTISDASGTITNPITKQPFVVHLHQATGGSSVSIASASFGGGSSITFNATGEPVLPGTDTPISSSSIIALACGSATRSVSITPVIGKISAN